MLKIFGHADDATFSRFGPPDAMWICRRIVPLAHVRAPSAAVHGSHLSVCLSFLLGQHLPSGQVHVMHVMVIIQNGLQDLSWKHLTPVRIQAGVSGRMKHVIDILLYGVQIVIQGHGPCHKKNAAPKRCIILDKAQYALFC